jgi:hypothetical protein
LVVGWLPKPTAAAETCWFDPIEQVLRCEDDGVITDPGAPGDDPWVVPGSGGLRYLYQQTDPVVGDCYYWSNVPGGLDTWDPANDAAVIGVVLSVPECPSAVAVDPENRAWEIFRSWSLAIPEPSLQPADHGITGLPSYLATNQPAFISYSEVLPDGRTLQVRADVTRLTVSWGDGDATAHAPEQARAFPEGAVTHLYHLKTCIADYRANHPSGGLCHPTLDHYDITVTFDWGGSYNVDGIWIDLGTLTRSATVAYDVDEARGVQVP